MTVEQHINDHFARTGWPYLKLMDIINEFGQSARDELNALHKAGKIKKTPGLSGDLIEIIRTS